MSYRIRYHRPKRKVHSCMIFQSAAAVCIAIAVSSVSMLDENAAIWAERSFCSESLSDAQAALREFSQNLEMHKGFYYSFVEYCSEIIETC